MSFSDVLRYLLFKRGITQADVCRLTGIPTSLMSNYIKGVKSPTLTNSIKLAQAFNITLDELAGLSLPDAQDKTVLSEEEYPIMTKYRRLNDSGKEYIDAQLDFAMSQDKYCAKEKRPPHIPDMATIREDAEAYANQLINQNTPTKK